MNTKIAISGYMAACLLFCSGATRSWSAGAMEDGFLRKKDFRITNDSVYALRSIGRVSPAGVEFDFSVLGDTGAARNANGKVFSTAWKPRCVDGHGDCDFFLTVLRRAEDSVSSPAIGPELHVRVYDTGSTAAIEIATRILQEENGSKLESRASLAIGDSIAQRQAGRRKGNFRILNGQEGYDLKLSVSTSLGKQKLSVYTREIGGAFKLPQIKILLPAGFSADSIAFLAADSTGGAKFALSDAYAGTRTWNYVTSKEAGFLKKLSQGVRPGLAANHDYFGDAIFLLIKSSEGSGDQFGTWEAYKENTRILRNASGSRELLPIQILRTSIHEKSARGAMLETPIFLCTTPKQELSTTTADLFLDPGSIFGEAELKEVRVTSGKTTKTLAMGEKLKIDFTDGPEKAVGLEVVYMDGFKSDARLVFRGPSKKNAANK